MSNFKSKLTKQLNGLNDREENNFFNAYNSNIRLYSDEECMKEIHYESVIESDLYYDGDGIIQQSVYRFTSFDGDELLVKFYGSYQSFVGETYHGWKFVEAKEKTITVYE